MTTVSEPSGNLKLSTYPLYVPESGLAEGSIVFASLPGVAAVVRVDFAAGATGQARERERERE